MYKQNKKKVDMYEQIIKFGEIEFCLIAEFLASVLVVWGVVNSFGFKNGFEFVESISRNGNIDILLVIVFAAMFCTVGETVINQFKGIESSKSNESGVLFIVLAALIVFVVTNSGINSFSLLFSVDMSFITFSLSLLTFLIIRSFIIGQMKLSNKILK